MPAAERVNGYAVLRYMRILRGELEQIPMPPVRLPLIDGVLCSADGAPSTTKPVQVQATDDPDLLQEPTVAQLDLVFDGISDPTRVLLKLPTGETINLATPATADTRGAVFVSGYTFPSDQDLSNLISCRAETRVPLLARGNSDVEKGEIWIRGEVARALTERPDVKLAATPAVERVATRRSRISRQGFLKVLDAEIDTTRALAMIKPIGARAFVRRTTDGYEAGHEVEEDGRYAIFNFKTFASAPGGFSNLLQLETCRIGPLLGPPGPGEVDERNPGIVYAGGWVASSAGAASFKRSDAAGDSAEFTFPVGATTVGLLTARAAKNGGYSRHVITDDRGRTVTAALLPTAQDEVDAGRLSPSVLTTGCGNLAPTDRVWDGYGDGNFDGKVGLYRFAEGLDPARAYKLTSHVTGYKRAASVDVRLYVCGFGWQAKSEIVGPLDGARSAWEYAMNIKNQGQSVAVGNLHGYDEQTGWEVRVDGRTLSLAPSQTVEGESVLIKRTSTLHHPAVGAVGQVIVRYYFEPGAGMWVDHQVTWFAKTEVSYFYPVMWPNSLSRGRFAGIDANYDLDLHDLSTRLGGRRLTYYAWQPGGGIAGLLRVDPGSVDYWQHTNLGAFVEDRATQMNKVYVPFRATSVAGETSSAVSVPAGTVWRSRALYRMAVLPDADATLGHL